MTRDELIEAMALAAFNRMRQRAMLRPVSSIGANNTPEANFYRSEVAATLSDIEAVACVVPPFGMASAEAEESAGEALYEHFAFYPNEQKPAWTPAGNAIRQDDARRLAMCAVNAWLAASPFRSKP